MQFSVLEAGREVGKSKSTIQRAIKRGELSATKNSDGEYEIDSSELFRVYDPVAQAEPEPVKKDTGIDVELVAMLKAKEAEIVELRDDLEDTKERLSEHREAAQLLEHTTTEQQKQIDLAKREAEQRAKEWQTKLAERQAEIQAARTEAEALSEKAAKDIAQIERRAAEERKAREQLQSRGLIARIFNRPVTG